MPPKDKPSRKPRRPFFSSGPCAKRPDWSLGSLRGALVGRSHRSAEGKARLQEVIERSKDLIGAPKDYALAILPGSCTGAIEAALWSLAGERGMDLLIWDHFAQQWKIDVQDQLRISDVRVFEAAPGMLPSLHDLDPHRDWTFVWNGTVTGTRPPNDAWLPDRGDSQSGLRFCDAASAMMAMPLPVEKLDVLAWSWQKALGGEAAHGMLLLSPSALARLESYQPPWPVPKLFQLSKAGKVNAGIFRGVTINTPSMLGVEDVLSALRWAEREGGLRALIARSNENLEIVSRWEARVPWCSFVAAKPEWRSPTAICLRVRHSADVSESWSFVRRMVGLLHAEEVAYDIAGHRDGVPGLRIWGGPTVDPEDMEALLPWLEWAYHEASD